MRNIKMSKSVKRNPERNLEQEIALAIRTAKSSPQPLSVVRVREDAGLSTAAFAKLLDASPAQLNEWENGASEPSAQVEKLIRIIDVVSKVIDRMSE